MMVVTVRPIFISMSQHQAIRNWLLNFISISIIIFHLEILAKAVSAAGLEAMISPRHIALSILGKSNAQSLKVSTVHRDDIKTFEGNWNIVLSKTPRTAFPPLSRSTVKRGSYIEIKDHIMH